MNSSDADATAATADASAPRTFGGGRYLVRRVLGSGGQKIVYQVQDTTLGRDCALSLLRCDELRPDDVARLRHEARALATLGAHPHVVTVYDLGEELDRQFVVCEYVPGGDLAQLLRRTGGPLPLARAVALGRELLQALTWAHQHGIVHRWDPLESTCRHASLSIL